MKAVFLAGTALALSALSFTPALADPAAPPAATAATAPSLGRFGVDETAIDKSVAPGDDFYRYVNGNWDKRTEIPADRAGYGSFYKLIDLSEQRTRGLIEDAAKTGGAPGSGLAKVGTTYATFMDAAAIEAKGAAPLKPDLDAIAAISTPAQLAHAFAVANRRGITVPISLNVSQDLKDNTVYTVYASQNGLGMPDRDYYLSADKSFVETRGKYVTHVATMLRLAGYADPDGAARRIFDFEKAMATVEWTKAEQRDVDKSYNPVATTELATRMPGLDWTTYLADAGLGAQPRMIVGEPSAQTAIAKIVAATPMPTLREYLAYQTITEAARYLSSPFVDENFAFYGTVLSGTPQLRDRWKRGVQVVDGALGEAVGQIYVERYFTPDAKAKADELVRNLIAAMDLRLAKLTWMAPETKAKARAKLAAFTAKIGYPANWRDYSKLEVVAGDALGNGWRATEFEYDRNLAKIGKPVDRSEWQMTPQTVNAYAGFELNEIVFPAAILQAPFFDPNADPAVNYGGIGAVIGHEISHHFDDQGSKFDPSGNLHSWWTPADVTRFKAYTDRVVAQYSAYEPIAGMHVNGALTLGENMADLAGLNVAYDAYKLSLKGKPAPVIGGYTGDQRFFLGFGQIWQEKQREAAMRDQLTTDPHTIASFRPYVARNVDVWYDAFAVKPGQKLYLLPKDRVKVW